MIAALVGIAAGMIVELMQPEAEVAPEEAVG